MPFEKKVANTGGVLKIRRALLSVSDKTGIVELAQAMAATGTELVATGKTAALLKNAGLSIVPIEKISGSPEAFQGRMKTLSFPVCSGILFRREDESDALDLERLNILPIDCVVVNFYPFELAAAKAGIEREALIEEVDIGGPTLVRAAAKNVPDVLCLTDASQYSSVMVELKSLGGVSHSQVEFFSKAAWDRVLNYDSAIARVLGGHQRQHLRYGENPHQKGFLELDSGSPIDWDKRLTLSELSYNNILDLSGAYSLVSDLVALDPQSTSVVIVKHNNPCGVAMVPRAAHANLAEAQCAALIHAWESDPVSAFGGVVLFSDPIEESVAAWLSERFIELVAAPGLTLDCSSLKTVLKKRKNLKAVSIRRWGEVPKETQVSVPGGKLFQTSDTGIEESLKSVTQTPWPSTKDQLARFGIVVNRALKSNAVSLVKEIPDLRGAWQLVGAGQGQPNRVEALERLAIPRALGVVHSQVATLGECVLVSDAFFPFRDTVDVAHRAGIQYIVQPGGSLKDAESIAACNEHGIAMVFTGVRHFRH